MTGSTLTWLDDEDPRDLRRWALAAFIVVCIHLAAIAVYVYVHRPDEVGDDASPITIDYTPGDDTVDQAEIAPQPEQPQQPPPQVEQPPPPPPPPLQPDAAVALPEVKPVEQPPPPPPPPPTPARAKGGVPTIEASWQSSVVRRIKHFERYPEGARSRGVTGVVGVAFTVDRNGHVLAHSVTHSSGSPELDAEAMSIIERAQPMPPMPPSMSNATVEFTFPLAFELH